MSLPFEPGYLVRQARARMGLSQRDMAARAGTSQSVVARIETDATDPGSATLAGLLAAAALELRCELEPIPVVDSHMLEDVDRILALTPEERLREVANVERFVAAARRV